MARLWKGRDCKELSRGWAFKDFSFASTGLGLQNYLFKWKTLSDKNFLRALKLKIIPFIIFCTITWFLHFQWSCQWNLYYSGNSSCWCILNIWAWGHAWWLYVALVIECSSPTRFVDLLLSPSKMEIINLIIHIIFGGFRNQYYWWLTQNY